MFVLTATEPTANYFAAKHAIDSTTKPTADSLTADSDS